MASSVIIPPPLSEYDLIITGRVQKILSPLKKKVKRIVPNKDSRLFFIKKNYSVVKHVTKSFLKLRSVIINNLSFDERKFDDGENEGMSYSEIAKAITSSAVEGVLPLNILTNSTEISTILRFLISNNDIQESMFRKSLPESRYNSKNKTKIKIICLKDNGGIISQNDLKNFYLDNYQRKIIQKSKHMILNKQHCYLKNNAKRCQRNTNEVYSYKEGMIFVVEYDDDNIKRLSKIIINLNDISDWMDLSDGILKAYKFI